MKKIHLLCNAHLDPVWLWQKPEGMAEAIATFRIAADFCEKYDNFVFNHNESVIYEWVLENEPELFERIKKLVKTGKWQIMGGWYLQPDVIMPCGESVIRQIKVGNDFFKKHFGTVPKTSIGFDAFGHSRGLVQILKKCGYENYAYLRPRNTECGPFIWVGFDGSEVIAFKMFEWYNTRKGQAIKRIEDYIRRYPDRVVSMVTWGIGNHGGGPSKKDLEDINEFIAKQKDYDVAHSSFDAYFNDIDKANLERVNTSLMHCNVGCYTSMVRIKQGHRNLESKLAMCEKMLCQTDVSYDKNQLSEAEKALLFTEFHDVLPGSAIKNVEEDSLKLIGYGEEIADRLISKAFFRLCQGQPKAKEGEIPVLAYNPHPYPICGDFEVEFQMAVPNHPDNGLYCVKMKDEKGNPVFSQLEQEDSAHGNDWRKKVVFHAELKPMCITRFDCELWLDSEYKKPEYSNETEKYIVLKNESTEVKISKKTGLIEQYIADGNNVVNSVKIKVFRDNEDPWGMEVDEFSEYIGEFELISDEQAYEFRGGIGTKIPNVVVIESGSVRTKAEAIFKYKNSYAVVTYTLSDFKKMLDIDIKILSNDANVMYKLCVDTTVKKSSKALVQTMFGTEEALKEGKEIAFQKWCGLNDLKNSLCVLNKGTYGGSMCDSEIRISLLRTSVYAAHPVDGVELVKKDRTYNRIDMGERDFKFRLCPDEKYIDYEAEIFNQEPFILSFFPSGDGKKHEKVFEIDNKNIILSTYKKVDNGILIRLFNSSQNNQTCTLNIKNIKQNISFTKFEVKTFVLKNNMMTETNMLGI